MFDEIDIDDFQFDNIEQNIAIYTSFVEKASLEVSDRDSLKKKRGFSDQIIDSLKFRTCQPSNRDIISDLKNQFGEESLIDAGLLEYNQKKELSPCLQLITPNILIPYFNEKKQIYYIRPHKFGLKDKGISIYCPIYPSNLGDSKKTWVITESEFKAVASISLGYPAIGLPGIHSYAANNFHRLVAWFKPYVGDISSIIIIFDNEIKNDARFPNYKPDVMKQWDTQWRSAQMARELNKELKIKVLIGKLPDEWMVDGKIDIDGALALGKTKEDYQLVIKTAMSVSDYTNSLPPVAQQIITKKFQKLDYQSPIIKKDNCYFIKKPIKKKKDDPDEEADEYILNKISNFTLTITKTVIDNNHYSREVIFKGQDGSVSATYPCPPDMVVLREFIKWIASCGNLLFTGSQDDLFKIFDYEYVNCDGRKISRPQAIGFLKKEEKPIWLLGNCAIKLSGEILLPDKEDIIWDGLDGYQPCSIKEGSTSKKSHFSSKMPLVSIDEEFNLHNLYKVVESIREIYNTKSIYLAVGWIIATFFSEEVFKQFGCFPILFISGRKESGKTTLGNWLMAMAGFSEASADSLPSATEAGASRVLEWFNSLPYWLDEFRNDAKISKWDGFFRNAYQRQPTTKGTLGSRVRSHEINAGIILSGEETPQDAALLSRCLVIQLSKAPANRNVNYYGSIEKFRRAKLLSRLLVEVLRLRDKLIPSILGSIEGMKERLIKNGVGERIALNYAIPTAFFQDVFLANRPESEGINFINYVLSEALQGESTKESEHMLNVFMEDLVTIQDDLKDYYMVFKNSKADKGNRRIALHWKTFYSKWVDFYRRKGNTQFKAGTLLSYIEEETYFIGKNVLKRLGPSRKMTRCLVLSLDPADEPPPSLLTLADGNEAVETIDDDDTIAAANAGSDDLPF